MKRVPVRSALPLLVILLLAPSALAAVSYPDPDRVPKYYDSECISKFDRRFVHDFIEILGADHGAGIEGAACEVYAKTSAHFVLVTVQDTQGEPLDSYALHLFERWGVGAKDENDGIMLIFVADDKVEGGGPSVRLEVGYGLEGVFTATASRQAIDVMRDARAEALDAGESDAVSLSFALAVGSAYVLNTLDDHYVDGRFPAPEPASPTIPWWFWLIVALIVISAVSVLSGAARGGRRSPGWGYHPGSAAWSRGMGSVFVPRSGGGFGGGGFGGGFGGGRSGGGGGRGRL